MAYFLSFEGIDGCGKSTQLQLLRDYLTEHKQRVTATREPGGTELAEAIRNYLLHSTQPLASRTELLLFGAARAQHVEEIIRPALQRGDWVLSDRFADSSLAYQGGGLGLDTEFIRTMNAFATGALQPHLTLLFDVELDVALSRRAQEKNDRIEARGREFQERVRQAFLEAAQCEPQRVKVLPAQATPAEIHQNVLSLLRENGMLNDL
jgi:dTMP kinase